MGDYTSRIGGVFLDAAYIVLIYLCISAVASVAGNVMIGGWVFAPKNAAPKLSKINPIKGIKRIFR